MIIFRIYFILLVAAYDSRAVNLNSQQTSRNGYSSVKGNGQMKCSKSLQITDEMFKPKAFDAYIDLKKKRLTKNGNSERRPDNIKQMINSGMLLNMSFLKSKKMEPLLRTFSERPKRSRELKIKNEIDSTKIFPMQSKGTKSLECHKDNDEEISCKKDDFVYKIKLKHNDLSQENLESLIRSLYLRLSSSAPTVKLKRSDDDNRGAQLIPLPPPNDLNPNFYGKEKTNLPGPVSINYGTEVAHPLVNECCDEIHFSTTWPYKPCKSCECYDLSSSSAIPPVDNMMIECSPREIEPVVPNQPRSLIDKKGTTNLPNAYVYSCRWQGRRHLEREDIIVPLSRNEFNQQVRKSFKVIINPSEADSNSLYSL